MLSVIAVGIVSLPLAIERGLENTVVRDTLGVVPATFSLTGTSDSRLRLGILGSIHIPVSKGPLGVSATIDGPPPTAPGESEGVESYFSPEVLRVYSGLFHDPDSAQRGYVEALESAFAREVLKAELFYAGVGGLVLVLLLRVLDPAIVRRLDRHRWVTVAVAVPVAVAISAGVAWFEFQHWSGSQSDSRAVYSLPSLDGTRAEGAVTDSAVLRLAIENAYPKVQLIISRQQAETSEYVASATSRLDDSSDLMAGPDDDENAIMMQSDMHCNVALIELQARVVAMLNEKYGDGTISLLAISGDLTTNGTAAEGACIKDEAAIADGAAVAAVTGNHESDVSAQQMRDAGMHVLEGETVELAGTTVLGDGDPMRTEMFGATTPRGDSTQESVGEAIFDAATTRRPDLVLLHEAYAVQSFLGSDVDSLRTFLDDRGSATEFWEDGIRDLPTAAVFYGHWHRHLPPRVVWNSDRTWTLVMELNTSGGAVAAPTLNHFSTPWSRPQQLASFPVVFQNRDSGLITGYQLYSFATDGEVTVEPRIDIGAVAGTPARGQGDRMTASADHRQHGRCCRF